MQNDFDQERTSGAIYADTTYDLNEALTFCLELRYTKDETDLENFSARVLSNNDVPLLNTIPGDLVDPYAKAADKSIDLHVLWVRLQSYRCAEDLRCVVYLPVLKTRQMEVMLYSP